MEKHKNTKKKKSLIKTIQCIFLENLTRFSCPMKVKCINEWLNTFNFYWNPKNAHFNFYQFEKRRTNSWKKPSKHGLKNSFRVKVWVIWFLQHRSIVPHICQNIFQEQMCHSLNELRMLKRQNNVQYLSQTRVNFFSNKF